MNSIDSNIDRRVWRRPGKGRVWRHIFTLLPVVLTLERAGSRRLAGALVRADSPLHSVRELDRPDQIIGINTDDSVGVWLRERLTAARLRATTDYTLREAVQWLQDGTVVAFAGGRQRLASGTQNVRGLRLLDDNFYGVPPDVV